MKRRFLSTLMALCLALSLLPTAAFAAEGDEAPVEDGGTHGQRHELFCKWYANHHYRQCARWRHKSEL